MKTLLTAAALAIAFAAPAAEARVAPKHQGTHATAKAKTAKTGKKAAKAKHKKKQGKKASHKTGL